MMANTDGWRELSFIGRSAVVTGAARGIGRAVAYRLAGLGARTVIWDLDGEVAEQTAAELGELLASQGRRSTSPIQMGCRAPWRKSRRQMVSMSW